MTHNKHIIKICFVDNFNKTLFFIKLAQELEKSGVTCYWIAFSKKRFVQLSKIFPQEHILLLNKSIQYSKSIGEFKLNELVYADRVLRYDFKLGLEYLQKIQKPFFNFVSSNEIRHIFGETTYAHEVLMHRIVRAFKDLNCIYLNPHTIRIPSNRFAFFTTIEQDRFYELNNSSEIETEIIKLTKPDYFYSNNAIINKQKSIVSRIRRVKRFISRENIENDHPALISRLKLRFKKGFLEELNRLTNSLVRYDNISKLNNKMFVFFPLHKQPEASIDVIGMYYEDQYLLIKNISKFIPENFHVVVKEHPNAIGDRRIVFYQKLRKIHNLLLISPHQDSNYIINNSQAVFTVSGTPAYEASLQGKISFTFAPCFFNLLENCFKISIDDFRNFVSFYELCDVKQSYNSEKMSPHQFSEYLIKNSFLGSINNPVTDISCMKDSNINNVKLAFLNILEKNQ